MLLLLGYYREYRTRLALAADFGLSESRCSILIREVESLLLKDRRFHLQGKKALLVHSNASTDRREMDHTVIIDVRGSPVERPKKSSVVTIQREFGMFRIDNQHRNSVVASKSSGLEQTIAILTAKKLRLMAKFDDSLLATL